MIYSRNRIIAHNSRHVRNHSSHFSSPSIRRSFHASPRFERLRPRTIEARARNQRIAAFRGVFHPVHIESPRQTRACSGRRTARVQPKPTRSTAPIAKDVDAAFDRAINAINADKLKRYALFDTVSRGGTQRADGWYQDNVEPAVTCAREERSSWRRSSWRGWEGVVRPEPFARAGCGLFDM